MQQRLKSQNFEMLRSQWPELANLGALAEQFSKNATNAT